jgi:5-methylcytosine-specific restriction protein A
VPLQPCVEPGCSALVVKGRCEEHARERQAELQHRTLGRGVYNTARWKRVRRRVLLRDAYTCRSCGRWGNEVDHIVPIAEGGDPWAMSNLQTLCKGCHSRKTAKETWHGGHRAGSQGGG